MKRILSLDGGGYRGLAVARFLYLARNDLPDFDLIAGNSTGGLIACSKAYGYSYSEILEFYLRKGPRIFAGKWLRFLRLPAGQRYASRNLDNILKDTFQDKKLKEACTRLLVASHDLSKGQAYFFREDKPHTLYDAARATVAAPTYFKPHKKPPHMWIDGGLYMNNPTLCAIMRARQIWGAGEKFEVISVGTGIREGENYIPMTGAGWLKTVISVGMHGSADLVDFISSHQVQNIKYTRYNFTYSKKLAMDDVSDNAQKVLMEAADATYSQTLGRIPTHQP